MQSNSKGIDVSHFQCDLDWSALKNEGISFAFVKATEGETYVDPCFHKNWANGQKEGLKLAPYHFYRSKDNPGKQADLFIKTVKVITDRLDMAPALDIEMETAPISHEQFADDILQWLKRVEGEFGLKPYVYCSHSFGNEYLSDPAFAEFPLWIASYDRETPLIPTAWKNAGYKVWQKGQKEIGGMQVDFDVTK